jgi:aconitate hydratase 2/2-methylisocitrate dehydratase
MDEYKNAVEGIDLTKFTPPTEEMTTQFIPVKRV